MIGSDADREELASRLRDFADRVEDGELSITEIVIRSWDRPHVSIEKMNKDELERLHALFE